MLKLTAGLWIASACLAQQWEVGGGIGYGWYHNASIISPAGQATAGIGNRLVATVVVTENLYQHFSGEVRYVYHGGPTLLASRGVETSVSGQSHSLTYDVVAQLNPREAWFRPYVVGGIGAKFYDTNGRIFAQQPLARIGVLTTNSQWKPLVDFGGGVKFRLSQHVILRGDLRDYITPFPDRLFVPAANGRRSGVLHQITPLFGVSTCW
jgi:hypothetical protein